MTNKTYTNAAKCLKCGDVIFSKHRHDYVSCSCGNVSVDGGFDYSKRGYQSEEWVNVLSVTVNPKGKIVEIGKTVNPFNGKDIL